jgi:ABC-type polysaccharide/polyol phosphate transport system ATPase subunit
VIDNAIAVHNVTKKYRVHFEKNNSFKERFIYSKRNKWKDYIALNDVSINIKKGQTVGLIGKNGSGKSTLLKLISRILYPDKGNIIVNGRVSSLLELGAGFHPDFSGRENIYMNGALIGLSKKEINYKIDEIIDFSELGQFIDEPVRTYSSGMYMRLAFSVSVAVEPEILLVDEILAVGDAAFQAKGMKRIRQLQATNKTIVIVTHDSSFVQNYCHEAIWLNNSVVYGSGSPADIIPKYLEDVFKTTNNSNSEFENKEQGNCNHRQDSLVNIISVAYKTENGSNSIKCSESLKVDINISSSVKIDQANISMKIYAENNLLCYGTSLKDDKNELYNLAVGESTVRLIFNQFMLLPGEYTFEYTINSIDGFQYLSYNNKESIRVYSESNELGIVRLEHQWEF